MDLDLDTLAGKELPYFGACGHAFKLGDLVLEAVEDENDGYRSSLEKVRIIGDPNEIAALTFSDTPIAVVIIEAADYTDFDAYPHAFRGHLIKDAIIDFEWGRVGTNNHDDYYPSFNCTFGALDPEQRYSFRGAAAVNTIAGAEYPTLRDKRLGLLPEDEPRRREKVVLADDPLHGSW